MGAILGAAVGGAAGAYIGDYMDKQAAEIERDLEGATVERVGEGIKITFDSGILFDVDKATLKDKSRTDLAKLAVILQKYEDTNILLVGHTDKRGTKAYNQVLSEKRAHSVKMELEQQFPSLIRRLKTEGRGEAELLYDGDTESDHMLNRRVKVTLIRSTRSN